MSDLQQLHAPVSVTVATDAPIAVEAKIPAAKNYADVKELANLCESDLYGIITRTKDRRRLLEDEWLAIQRMSTLTHDGGQKYKGRSNVYMPNYANARAVMASQLSRGLFPSDDYMDVEAQSAQGYEAAEQVKSALKYELECNAKVRQHIKPALLQLVDHGNMVIKYWYRTGNEFVGKKQKDGAAAFKERPAKGLAISARSIFNVIVYPETAEDENDVLVTAEYMEIDRNYAIALGKGKRWINMERALASGNINSAEGEHQYSRDQSLMDQAKIAGMMEQVDTSDGRKPIAQLVMCVEAYANLRLPGDAYVEGEDKTLPVPARVTFLGGVVVEIVRNTNYDQKTPYLWARQGVIPGSFYGSWAGRRARHLQYLINDIANQTNDTGIMGLNPFMVVDTNLLTGPLMPYAPGRVFHTRDVKNAIAFQHPPMEPIQYGHQMLGLHAGALADGVGAPPVLQGVGKSGETATGQSILQRNALNPLQDVVEDIEAQVMQPLMERAWRLTVQFGDRAVSIQMPDGSIKQLGVGDLDEFDYNFKFLSSSQAANQQARAMNAIQVLQMLPGIAQLQAATGTISDPAYVLRKLAADFGWRQVDQFIKPMPMMGPMGAPGQAPPEQGGGAPQQEAPEAARGSEQNAPIPGAQEQDPVAVNDFEVQRAITDELNALEGGKALG